MKLSGTLLTLIALVAGAVFWAGRMEGRMAAVEAALRYYHGSVKVPE